MPDAIFKFCLFCSRGACPSQTYPLSFLSDLSRFMGPDGCHVNGTGHHLTTKPFGFPQSHLMESLLIFVLFYYFALNWRTTRNSLSDHYFGVSLVNFHLVTVGSGFSTDTPWDTLITMTNIWLHHAGEVHHRRIFTMREGCVEAHRLADSPHWSTCETCWLVTPLLTTCAYHSPDRHAESRPLWIKVFSLLPSFYDCFLTSLHFVPEAALTWKETGFALFMSLSIFPSAKLPAYTCSQTNTPVGLISI